MNIELPLSNVRLDEARSIAVEIRFMVFILRSFIYVIAIEIIAATNMDKVASNMPAVLYPTKKAINGLNSMINLNIIFTILC